MDQIQYASRTRATTDAFRRLQQLKNAAHELLQALPEDLRKLPEAGLLESRTEPMALKIVHLIHHAKPRQGTTKAFEFSRLNMREPWRTGYTDAVRTLRHPETLARPDEDILDGGRRLRRGGPRPSLTLGSRLTSREALRAGRPMRGACGDAGAAPCRPLCAPSSARRPSP